MYPISNRTYDVLYGQPLTRSEKLNETILMTAEQSLTVNSSFFVSSVIDIYDIEVIFSAIISPAPQHN